jgi:hypothetical protein
MMPVDPLGELRNGLEKDKRAKFAIIVKDKQQKHFI